MWFSLTRQQWTQTYSIIVKLHGNKLSLISEGEKKVLKTEQVKEVEMNTEWCEYEPAVCVFGR